jgi:hypothetical protein
MYFIAAYFDLDHNPVGLGSDGYEYWHLSTSIIKHHTFAYTAIEHYPILDLTQIKEKNLLPEIIPCTVRVPGYPFILAVFRHFWDSPWMAVVLNIFGYAGICLYGFRLGGLLLPDGRQRLVYDFLLVFNPLFFVRWGMGSDILAAFFLTGFTFHMIRIYRLAPLNMSDAILAVLWGIAAILTRSNLVIYCSLFVIGLIFGGILRQKTKSVIACMTILFLLLIPAYLWMQRNQTLTGKTTFSTQGGAVLYTVHLAYDLSPKDPLSIWKTDGKAGLLVNALAAGKTFNQAEIILDEKLKSVVIQYDKNHPMHFFKKLSDGLRTMFFFSYYDISDAIMASYRNFDDRMAFAHSSSSDFHSYTDQEQALRNKLFQISRIYKWLLALSFFIFPLVWICRQFKFNSDLIEIPVLYTALLSAILTTAMFTGAGGDRMRLPFTAVILLFAVLSAHGIFQRKTNN